MMTRCNLPNGNYNHDSVFIQIDNEFYIIDTEIKLKESLYKYKDEYDIVINFLGETNTYILYATYTIGLYYNTCYVFKNIKDRKIKNMFIRSFTYKRISSNFILNIDDYVLYEKAFDENKNKISLPKFSIRTSPILPRRLPVSVPLEVLKYTSYDYINYITKLHTED